MQLTINVKDSVLDKVLYLLENLKSDVQIVKRSDTPSLEIDVITETDADYSTLLEARESRKNAKANYEDYVSLDDVNWE